MKLTIENVGKLKKAEIKLDGLTVLTGHNNTGKSTIGKVVFALTKGLNDKEALNSYHDSESKRIISKFIIDIVEGIHSEPPMSNLDKSRVIDLAYHQVFRRGAFDVGKFLDFSVNGNLDLNLLISSTTHFIENQLSALGKNIIINLNSINVKTLIDDTLEALKAVQIKSRVQKTIIDFSVSDAFNSTFNTERNLSNEVDASYEKKDDFANIYFTINKYRDVMSSIQIPSIDDFFIESTYIDSSYILNFITGHPLIGVENTKMLYITDLLTKLKTFNESNTNSIQPDLLKRIKYLKLLLPGEITTSAFGELKFTLKDGKDIEFTNVSSGVKSISMIIKLIENGFVNSSSILVVDEPENYLHPQWQLEYAMFICELVKNRITVLVSSHSLYMIEALEKYSRNLKISGNTNFYLMKNDKDDMAYSTDVTQNIDEIFQLLAEPMIELTRI